MTRTRRDNRRGSALVELALGISMMTLLLMGATDFGPLVSTATELQSAARAGALYGATSEANSNDDAGIQNVALAAAPGVPGMTATSALTWQCPGAATNYSSLPSCVSGTPLAYVSVTTRYAYRPVIPYPGVGSPVNLERTVWIRVK